MCLVSHCLVSPFLGSFQISEFIYAQEAQRPAKLRGFLRRRILLVTGFSVKLDDVKSVKSFVCMIYQTTISYNIPQMCSKRAEHFLPEATTAG